jgi:hypothetical protein
LQTRRISKDDENPKASQICSSAPPLPGVLTDYFFSKVTGWFFFFFFLFFLAGEPSLGGGGDEGLTGSRFFLFFAYNLTRNPLLWIKPFGKCGYSSGTNGQASF